ncbi:MAG: hypothetical protein QW203_03770 [Thermoplasmatales archaeon]
MPCTRDHSNISVEYTTFIVIENTIYEQVSSGFVKWDTTNDTWEIVDHIHTGKMIENPKFKEYKDGSSNGEPAMVELVYFPLINETVSKGQIVLADQPEECSSLMDIIREIEEKAGKWIYISPEELPIFKVQIRIAVASWFLYVYDSPKIPERIAGLIGVVGVSGGGKKRFLTLLRMFAYRPIYTLNSTKIPSTFRLVEPWGKATLLVDEADQKETGSEEEWIQFFNARYDGTPISRYNANKKENETFQSFGLTAFALRRLPKDEGTISRMTKLNATISPIIVPELAGQEMYDDFTHIRNKLLYLRLKYYGKLKFVGQSGLPPEHSWRGKEVLTLIKVLAQIDPAIEQDLFNISKLLTEREIQNLSQSWDGLIINEIFNFITGENVEYGLHRGALYFVRTYREKDGRETKTALTLSYLAKALSTTASDINRSLVQMKIGVNQRFKIEDGKPAVRGILRFEHVEDTDRIFMRYVPGYNHELLRFEEETKQSTLPQKPAPKINTDEVLKKYVDEIGKNFKIISSEIDQYGQYRIALERTSTIEQMHVVQAFMKIHGFDMIADIGVGPLVFVKKAGDENEN